MEDREFLIWIHARLEGYGDDALCDFMHKLRAIIYATPRGQCTPNVAFNSLEELIEAIKKESP